MFSFLSNFLIYSYNDMAIVMIGLLSNKDGVSYVYGQFFTNSVGSIDLISNYVFFTLSNIFNYVFANNIIVIINLLLTFVASYLLFKNILKSRAISFAFALLVSFSLQYIFRVISFTQNLYPVFVIPLLIYFLVNKTSSILLSFYLLIVFLISSYYGYFCFFTVIFWELSLLIFRESTLKIYFKRMIKILLPIFVALVILYPNFIINNLPVFGRYGKKNIVDSRTEYQIYRPIEDYYNFSFRPWYFVIPPKSSLFFSDFSQNTYDKISSTNYYLADDYSEEEMGGTFMGWHFLLGLCVVAFLLLIKKFKNKEFSSFKSVYSNKDLIIRSFFVIFCILLISGPPSFTIRGIEIYTPSYLLYYVIPVFRTIVRWSVVIYLLILIINSFLIYDIYSLMRGRFQRIIFVVAFLFLNFVAFAVKLPVIDVNNPSDEVAFLKKEFPESVVYAVYPKGDYYSIFWIISHRDILVNPTGFTNFETGFDSNEFSKRIITLDGIKELKDKDVRYLIVYLNKFDIDREMQVTNPDIQSKEDLTYFFENNYGNVIYDYNDVKIFEYR